MSWYSVAPAQPKHTYGVQNMCSGGGILPRKLLLMGNGCNGKARFIHPTEYYSECLPGFADNLDTAIQAVTGQLRQLIDDTIRNFDIQALFSTLLKKATDIHTYIDFEPGLGPQNRSPGVSPRGEMGEFADAQESPHQPAWKKFVDILFEVDQQYPEELKYVSWGLISFSYMCAMGLLVLQGWDTRW